MIRRPFPFVRAQLGCASMIRTTIASAAALFLAASPAAAQEPTGQARCPLRPGAGGRVQGAHAVQRDGHGRDTGMSAQRAVRNRIRTDRHLSLQSIRSCAILPHRSSSRDGRAGRSCRCRHGQTICHHGLAAFRRRIGLHFAADRCRASGSRKRRGGWLSDRVAIRMVYPLETQFSARRQVAVRSWPSEALLIGEG